MQEVWKAIPGYESYYEVSDRGRVRSLERRTTDRLGRPFVRYGKLLSLNTEAKGYKSIRLCVETKHRTFKVHRLVAYAFLPQPLDGQQINHINGIKDDNRPENLEWVTSEENMRHAFSSGLGRSSLGENNVRAILCADDVRQVRLLSADGMTCAAISRHYRVSEATIRQILKGRNWSHVA
ncbi:MULTISPECIES: NUMOD4 motif-containing HNH endonuclease [unclassified Pseudomonas]|uniref:NUMOD4 motif-containing HNH endonuclease n=1 Tax=unclassified Pseudomonas TaxID=196821 RepID=UPI0025810A12|nr:MULTISPECIES: NUMOD4 motif-containing HNH endonuclease [unclassified Pseudomonas]